MSEVDEPGLLHDGRFRLLLTGQAMTLVAEQVFLVVLTLLVLDVAGSGAAVGTVLAVAALPRALLLPFGGVLSDRMPPALVAVAAVWARAAVLALLTLLVAGDSSPVWLIALLTGVMGALDAAFFPASMALLPRIVSAPRLPAANALVQGAESAGDLLGPTLAAILVTVAGFAGALGTVTAMYALAAVALSALTRHALLERDANGTETALAAIRESFRFAWSEPVVRTVLLVLVTLNVAVVGPLLVGGAVLAENQLGGREHLGIVFAGFGAGSLAGLIAAGARPPHRRGAVLIGGMGVLGLGLVFFGLAHSLISAVPLAALMGTGAGYLGVVVVAWLQERVPQRLLGRVMSLVAFSAFALDPLSYALAGALLPLGLTATFACAGGLVLACTAIALANASVRALR